MTDLNGIINGITQVTQVIGAVNGAVNTLAPALQSMDASLKNVAGTFGGNPAGYPADAYAQQPNYPQQGQVPATMQATSTSMGMGSVGSAIAGGINGGFLGVKTATTIKSQSFDPQIEGISSKMNLSPTAKTVAGNTAKAAGIGAVFSGLFSGVENFMKLSRGEITGSEATGHIVADTTVGLFAGASGFATGTMGAMALGGIGGVPGIIGAAVAGVVGGVGMDFLLRKVGLRDAISNGVRKILG